MVQLLIPRIIKLTIEAQGGGDQAQVRECLREISRMFTLNAQLFGIQAEVVRVAEHFSKFKRDLLRVVLLSPDTARTRKCTWKKYARTLWVARA